MRKVAKTSPRDEPATNRIIEAINNAVGQVGALAHGLDPIGMDADGLIAVLRELAENVSSVSNISCKFRCDGSGHLDSSTATHLYRICQEAVNNALKHAKAKQVIVSLTHNDGELVLSVEDDGIGLPDSLTHSSGMGLRIMKYRAGAIGANLTVRSRRSGGTMAQCILQLSPNRSNGDNPA
jgi:signal transduction histidine kinase